MENEIPMDGPFGRYLDYRLADASMDRQITGFSLIIAALFFLDIVTTQFILLLGGVELNPVMAGVVLNPLLHLAIKAGTLLLIILVSIIAEIKVRRSSVAFYSAIITLYIFVLVNNSFVLIPHIIQ